MVREADVRSAVFAREKRVLQDAGVQVVRADGIVVRAGDHQVGAAVEVDCINACIGLLRTNVQADCNRGLLDACMQLNGLAKVGQPHWQARHTLFQSTGSAP